MTAPKREMLHDIEPNPHPARAWHAATPPVCPECKQERERSARLREYILATGDHAAKVAMYNPTHMIHVAWKRVCAAKAAIDEHGDLEASDVQ